jgi:hypothetical protein
MNLSFEAEYTTIYYLTVIFNNAGQEEAVVYEYEEGDEFLLQNGIDFVESEDFTIVQTSASSNDSEPVFRTLSFITLSDPDIQPAVDAWYEDPKLQDSGLLVVTQSGLMPSRNLTLHARWNFQVEVQLQDPIEPDVVLGSGLFFPGELLDEESLTRMTFTNTLGYEEINWPENGFKAPKVLPSSGAQRFNPSYSAVPFAIEIIVGSGQSQTIENVFRGSGVNINEPVRAGFTFAGFYEDSSFSGLITLGSQGKFDLNAEQVASRGNPERTIRFYVKWNQLPPEVFTIRYLDEVQVEISSGSFESGSGITLTPPPVPAITHFSGVWSIPGNVNIFEIPTEMPFGDVDVVPYYELSSSFINTTISDAINSEVFSGLVIPGGETDLSVVSGVLYNLTSGLDGRPSNVSFTLTRSGALETTGENTYVFTLVSQISNSLTINIPVTFEYTEEFIVEQTVVEIEEELTTGSTTSGTPLSDGISDSPDLSAGTGENQIRGFRFQNQNDNNIICNLIEVEKDIVRSLSFAGATVNAKAILGSSVEGNSNRSNKFEITIQVGNLPTVTLFRWIYWETGGTLTYSVCNASWRP